MLLILARQAIGDGIKSGREIGVVYPMLRAIETTEDYTRYLESAEKTKPRTLSEEESRVLRETQKSILPTPPGLCSRVLQKPQNPDVIADNDIKNPRPPELTGAHPKD